MVKNKEPVGAFRPYSVFRWQRSGESTADDFVTVEEPLEIRVNGQALAVTMRTPGDDEELAAGFCLTEGVVGDGDELAQVALCDDAGADNVVDVDLDCADPALTQVRLQDVSRASFLSSSCGICGKQSLDRVEQHALPFAPSFPRVASATVAGLAAKVRRRQGVFARTGGLHSAAIADAAGTIVVVREDVGRHNAVDKVVGHCLLQRRDEIRESSILVVSGRTSFEIVQKAAVARIPIVVAVSAPTSLAVDLARRLNVTLIGFLRRGRFNVYHDAGRLG